MKEEKIAVIGVGGRTGTMFALELEKVSNVVGIGKEIETIEKKNLFIERKGEAPKLFEGRVVISSQFLKNKFLPGIIFLTTKNPVGPVVKYYYQRLKDYNPPKGGASRLTGRPRVPTQGRFPALILSQNGIAVVEDALSALKEILGVTYQKVRVVRLNLFNPIDRRETNNRTHINYSLPIRVSFGKVSGPGDLEDISLLFKKAGFEAKEFSLKEIRNMEFSKLFLNLIGMASATKGLTLNQGFKDQETFREEVGVLKEYIRVVRASGNNFLNFPHYPVKLFALLFEISPIKVFSPLRNYFAQLITKGREGKPKSLAEIEYYNGAVIELGKKTGIPTPINQRVLKRALNI